MMRSLRVLLVLLAVYPALVGYGGPHPFHVAPLEPANDNYVPGRWISSTEVSRKDEIVVIVMASWCPHCARMIEELAASSGGRHKADMILFFDDENGAAAREGKFITHPSKLSGRDLPYYFAKKGEFEGLYRGFPTILSCTREGCTPKSPADIGLG